MDTIQFSKAELERYSRHLILPDFTITGQRKLKAAKVLVVGSGGLGSPLLLYLTAAGVGTLGIVDFDVVDDSNLQRQVLFSVEDVGQPKVEAAKKRLQALNPHITIHTYPVPLSSDNAMELIQDYDVVADGTDNFPTRYLVNDACVLLGKPNVYASIFRYEGQASVFNYRNAEGVLGPNYRDLYPSPPPPDMVPNCAEGGVIGVLPGMLGTIQANEVIKVITGVGEPLSGRLFVFDAASFETRVLKIRRNEKNPLNGKNPSQHELIDYDQFCGLPHEKEIIDTDMKSITVSELKKYQDEGTAYQLIDVREPYEYEIVHINGELIPMGEIADQVDKIARDKPVIMQCRSGRRSADVIRMLEEKHGFDNLYNLEGGILAWAKEIDPSKPQY